MSIYFLLSLSKYYEAFGSLDFVFPLKIFVTLIMYFGGRKSLKVFFVMSY